MRNFEKTALMIVGLVGVIECAIHFVMYLSGKPCLSTIHAILGVGFVYVFFGALRLK